MTSVNFFPYQSYNLTFGGFEVQIDNTFEALDELNSKRFKFLRNNFWDKSFDYDIAHFWGLGTLNFESIKMAKYNNKKIIVTDLFPFFNPRFYISKYFGKLKSIHRILSYIDAIVVVSVEQKKFLLRLGLVDSNKIYVIPNIVGRSFFNLDVSRTTYDNYLICVGNICQRKNQLNIAKAVINSELKLVFVGKCIGEDSFYANEFSKLIQNSTNIEWYNNVEANSSELVSLISRSRGLILPSLSETQPISLLEAIVLNKPVLTSNLPFGKQSIFSNAFLTSNILNPKKLAIDLVYFSNNSDKYIVDIDKNQFSSNLVATQYIKLYEKIVSQ
jgi:glycosyltransferase involved in cell wall biosynthesis